MTEKYIVLDIETTGLNPWYGDRITCICAKDSDGKRLDLTDEKESIIIHGFFDWLNEHEPNDYTLVTHNGDHFDIPFIMARSVICGLYKVSNALRLLYYDHFDTAKITSKPIKLNDLAKLFGCQHKSGNGLNAIKLWKERRLNELAEYCANNVEVSEEVYLKHKELVGDDV